MAYQGFKSVESSIAKNSNVRDPGAVAAAIGREKYGAKTFQSHASSGKSLRDVKPMRDR